MSKEEFRDVLRSAIVVDEAINARKTKDKAYIESLRASIEEEGMLEPVILQPIEGEDGKFRLVAGFCRVAAADLAGWKTIPATIKKGTEKDAYIWNMVENVQRNDLTPHDLGLRCVELMEKFSMTGKEIATRLRKSVSYVNNLIRVVRMVHPQILKEWAAGKVDAKTDFLNKLATMKDQEKQLARWELYKAMLSELRDASTADMGDEGEEGESEGGESGEGGGGKRKRGKKGEEDGGRPARPKLASLLDTLMAIDKYRASGSKEYSADFLDGARKAMAYAVGKLKKPPVAPVPEPEPSE